MTKRVGLILHAEPKVKAASCETHGDYESRCYIGDVWSRCPACIEEAHQRESGEAESRAAAARLAAWQNRIGQAGIPERFHDRNFDNFLAVTEAQQRALRFCRNYADNFDAVRKSGRSAIFIGKPGTGKTHLACAIGLQIMRANRTVLFSTVMRALRRVKNTWSKGSEESEGQAISTMTAPDLLILDEVGVQFGTEFERHMLFDILNERYERRLSTIMMSNLPVEQVSEYLGERIIDRLREDGGGRIVFDWDSHRKTKGQA